MIYLDHNSSTYVLPHIYEQLSVRRDDFLGNADSQHAAGRTSKAIVDESRRNIASLINTKSGNVIFTSGATEANALALSSYINDGSIIFASAVEHKSVLKYADVIIPVNVDGTLNIDALKDRLYSHRWNQNIVIACMYANNETGVILDPSDDVPGLCRNFGAKLHIDASQCYAKGGSLTILQKECASTISLSGHKIHAMKGVGSLIFRSEIFNVLRPNMLGGAQELGLRPGTINTEAVYSFGVAASESVVDAVTDAQIRLKIQEIEHSLADIATVNGSKNHRLHNTTNLYFPKINDLQLFIEQLSVSGLMVSGMSACDSGMSTHSHVIGAMYGEDAAQTKGSIRISISPKTTWQEVFDAIEIIKKTVDAT